MAISETVGPILVNVRWNPFDQSWSAVSITDEDRQIPASSPYWVRLYEVPRQDTPSGVTVRLIVELGEPLDDSETDISLASAADWARINVDDVILVESEQMLVTSKGTSPVVNVTRGYGGTSAAAHASGLIMELLNSMTEVQSGSPADRQFRVDYTEARSALVLFNSGQSADWVRVDYYGLGTPLTVQAMVYGIVNDSSIYPRTFFNLYGEWSTISTTPVATLHAVKGLIPGAASVCKGWVCVYTSTPQNMYVALHIGGLETPYKNITVTAYTWVALDDLDITSIQGTIQSAFVKMYGTGGVSHYIRGSNFWFE